MKTHALDEILAAHPFFSNLPSEYLKLLAGCASNIRVDEGQFLFREGEEASRFFLLREGKIALEVAVPGRNSMILQTRQGGEIVGWSWLIPPYHWSVDARVIEQVRAVALDGTCLRKKCEEDHELGYELLKRFAHIVEQELTATRLRLVDVYGAPAKGPGHG